MSGTIKFLTEEKAYEFIQSLGQMRNYPRKQPEVMKQLVKALMLNGEEPVEEEIARAVVDWIMYDADSETLCPNVKELRQGVLGRLDRKFGEKRYDPDCPTCHGSGDDPVFFKDRNGDDLRASRQCTCLARRPEPEWEKRSRELPKDHVPAEWAEQLKAAKKGVVQ